MEIMNMLMASGSASWTAWHDWIKIIFLVVMALCAIFIVLVVLFQPGNSSGIGALGGQTETFLGKNKSKTFEHKMKKFWTLQKKWKRYFLCHLKNYNKKEEKLNSLSWKTKTILYRLKKLLIFSLKCAIMNFISNQFVCISIPHNDNYVE